VSPWQRPCARKTCVGHMQQGPKRRAPSPAFRPRRTMSSRPRIMVVGPIRKRADRTQQNCEGTGERRKHQDPAPWQRTTPLRSSVHAPPLRTRRTPQTGPGTTSARPPSRGNALRRLHSTHSLHLSLAFHLRRTARLGTARCVLPCGRTHAPRRMTTHHGRTTGVGRTFPHFGRRLRCRRLVARFLSSARSFLRLSHRAECWGWSRW